MKLNVPKRLLELALLAIPLGIILIGPHLINNFTVTSKEKLPRAVLLEGAAFASCDPMFRDFYRLDRSLTATGECKRVNGKRLMVAKADRPHGKVRRVRERQGVLIEYPSIYARRFVGNEIEVEIKARCVSCAQPVYAIVSGDMAPDSEWEELSFGDQISSQTFRYTVPEMELLEIMEGLKVIIDPYQENPEAYLGIQSVMVRAVN